MFWMLLFPIFMFLFKIYCWFFFKTLKCGILSENVQMWFWKKVNFYTVSLYLFLYVWIFFCIRLNPKNICEFRIGLYGMFNRLDSIFEGIRFQWILVFKKNWIDLIYAELCVSNYFVAFEINFGVLLCL